MKKIVYLMFICCLLILNTTGCSKNIESNTDGNSITSAVSQVAKNTTTSSEKKYIVPKQSQEELYQDIFNTLLSPYIQKAINNYYEKYLTISPTYSPDYVEILNIERPMGYRTFSFLIKLQIKTYVGPHIDIGVDQLTIRVSEEDGKVTVEKFEHIKDYFNELPENLKGIVKK